MSPGVTLLSKILMRVVLEGGTKHVALRSKPHSILLSVEGEFIMRGFLIRNHGEIVKKLWLMGY